MFGNRSSVWKGGIMFVGRIDILSGNRSTVRVYTHHNDVEVRRVPNGFGSGGIVLP